MTALRFTRIARPSLFGAPVEPMSKTDARAWKLTRERHPHLYRKEPTP